MLLRPSTACLFILFIFSGFASRGQKVDSLTDKVLNFPSRLFSGIQKKTASLDQQLTRQTEKYLQRLGRQEARLKKKIAKIDSAAAQRMFAADPRQRYALLAAKLKGDTAGLRNNKFSGAYLPYVDSLQGSLSFLEKNPQLVDPSRVSPAALQNSLGQVRQLEAKLNDADGIRQFIQQRKEQLKQYLNSNTQLTSGIRNAYDDYNKQLYYYGQQVKEYQDILNDPDKLFRTALDLLNRVPSFAGFMRSNSFLSLLAGAPGNGGGAQAGQAVQGLQTRDQVLSALQTQYGVNGPNAASMAGQNIQSAQGQLDQLRDKMNAGGNSGDLNMPDFKPNTQKTKSFLQRLEYGTNLQSTHSNYYFPMTTDLGLSIGYKLDKENRIGVGASYKVGWGNDFNHVNVSSQGAGLRSFVDIQVKKSFFASGGFEYNYQQPFSSFNAVKSLDSWQQSGLLGVSKILSMKTKVFKKTKLQLLWDFLSYQQVPKAQPLKFRLGYSF